MADTGGDGLGAAKLICAISKGESFGARMPAAPLGLGSDDKTSPNPGMLLVAKPSRCERNPTTRGQDLKSNEAKKSIS